MNTKRILFTCLAALFTGSSVKVNAQNLLEPAPSGFQKYILPYAASLKPDLMDSPSAFYYPLFGILCIPSDSPAWLLDNNYFRDNIIELTVAKESINGKGESYDSFKFLRRLNGASNTGVCKYTLNITDKERIALDSLFLYSITTTHLNTINRMNTPDGVRFIFMSRYQSGQCFSPQYGYTAELVDIAYKLHDIVKNKDQQALDDLMPEVERLTDKFRAVYRKMEELLKGTCTDSKTKSMRQWMGF